MTPKTLRDTIASALDGQTDAGSNVYSGRYLPHVVNNLLDTTDKRIIDVNIYQREYENTHPRSINPIGNYSVNLDCIVIVSDNVMDEVDELIEQVKTTLFDTGGLLSGDCNYIDGILSVNGWTETLTINTKTEKEFVIGTIVFDMTIEQ